jgi:hypothetical protein
MKNLGTCALPARVFSPMRGTPSLSISSRALATPEPFVRLFARRVQQEGALDLTQGDYKNADFAPHPEVVRAAQRITRNTVHSYGPAVGRMDVRNEVAEFFNRDGLTRLLLARELTLDEKREFVDLRIEGWLRALAEPLSRDLRREWSRLRELPRADFELDAIRRLIELEQLRGSCGA